VSIRGSNKKILGIDAGSSYIKLVLIDPAGQIIAKRMTPRGADIDASCKNSFDELLAGNNLSRNDIDAVIATGYGRRQVSFADQVITEITALAAGAHKIQPQAETIIDIGGQDSKVITTDASGRVIDFAMNHKCAAGTGRFLEVTSASLDVKVDQLGPLSKQADKELTLTSTCTVFAESEIISHIAKGEKKENVIKALHHAIANQILGLYHQAGASGSGPVLFVGGVALNNGMVTELTQKLNQDIIVPDNPQFMGAYGAALFLKNKKNLP
jgi:predicted CoA-substrate-specific enzyme activase